MAGVCTVCGTPDWIACDPGQAPYQPAGNVVDLHPEPERAATYWCLPHWPALSNPVQPKASSCPN